jgi:hypothetical protein
VDYEYRAVQIPADTDRETARHVLAIHAEFGGWELATHQISADGRRTVTVRRRVQPGLPPLAT